MILNVSKYTDIPLFYSDWFIDKIRKGQFGVEANKFNNIYKLDPSNYELLIFHTKNPKPIIKDLDILEQNDFKYIFLFALTPYNNSIEKNIGDKKQVLNTFKELSVKIGKDKVVWKYAPVILNQTFDKTYHYKYFRWLCKQLKNYTSCCIIDFINDYIPPVHAELYTQTISPEEKKEIMSQFVEIAKEYNIQLFFKQKTSLYPDVLTTNDLIAMKLQLICNIDAKGKTINEMDIGYPNTCLGNCEYCSCGGNNEEFVLERYKKHLKSSPLLIGVPNKKLPIKHIKVASAIDYDN